MLIGSSNEYPPAAVILALLTILWFLSVLGTGKQEQSVLAYKEKREYFEQALLLEKSQPEYDIVNEWRRKYYLYHEHQYGLRLAREDIFRFEYFKDKRERWKKKLEEQLKNFENTDVIKGIM